MEKKSQALASSQPPGNPSKASQIPPSHGGAQHGHTPPRGNHPQAGHSQAAPINQNPAHMQPHTRAAGPTSANFAPQNLQNQHSRNPTATASNPQAYRPPPPPNAYSSPNYTAANNAPQSSQGATVRAQRNPQASASGPVSYPAPTSTSLHSRPAASPKQANPPRPLQPQASPPYAQSTSTRAANRPGPAYQHQGGAAAGYQTTGHLSNSTGLENLMVNITLGDDSTFDYDQNASQTVAYDAYTYNSGDQYDVSAEAGYTETYGVSVQYSARNDQSVEYDQSRYDVTSYSDSYDAGGVSDQGVTVGYSAVDSTRELGNTCEGDGGGGQLDEIPEDDNTCEGDWGELDETPEDGGQLDEE